MLVKDLAKEKMGFAQRDMSVMQVEILFEQKVMVVLQLVKGFVQPHI